MASNAVEMQRETVMATDVAYSRSDCYHANGETVLGNWETNPEAACSANNAVFSIDKAQWTFQHVGGCDPSGLWKAVRIVPTKR
jgi:hypothetical protein